jgi:hypothetical protein
VSLFICPGDKDGRSFLPDYPEKYYIRKKPSNFLKMFKRYASVAFFNVGTTGYILSAIHMVIWEKV